MSFLRFLEGYIKAEKAKSDAIYGSFPYFASVFYIFEKNGWKKHFKSLAHSKMELQNFIFFTKKKCV